MMTILGFYRGDKVWSHGHGIAISIRDLFQSISGFGFIEAFGIPYKEKGTGLRILLARN